MHIGICGLGYVGRALTTFFGRSGKNEISLYDKVNPEINSEYHRGVINRAELVFVAVPTPVDSRGFCDTSQVVDAVQWITTPICIKSTVIPGTTDDLIATTGKEIVFSPEYIGEAPGHPWTKIDDPGFLIVGSNPVGELVVRAYLLCTSVPLRIRKTTNKAAELCKYMENCFLATKVAFVNQFFDIARELDVDFDELRELWLLDSRIGESHTRTTPERGFSGRCLPKDVRALVTQMASQGGAPLLEAMLAYNDLVRKQ